jgi:hypothetical protein
MVMSPSSEFNRLLLNIISFSTLTDPAAAVARGDVNIKCPECRGAVDPKRITDFLSFKKVHRPDLLKEDELDDKKENGSDLDSDSETDSDSDSDVDDEVNSNGDIRDFVVPDHDEVEEDDNGTGDVSESNESTAAPASDPAQAKGKAPVKALVKAKKKSRSSNGKERATEKKQKITLAQLKKEGMRNKKARKRYFRRLKKEWISSTKIDKTVEILTQIKQNDPTEKTLIFSQFTSLLDLLEVPLIANALRFVRYDGSMSVDDRTQATTTFRDLSKGCNVMLVSLKAGNAGLNLNCASQVIILDPFWNPYIEEQAIDRAHRLGQRRDVRVHRVVIADSVEDRILQLQEKKRELVESALDENAGKNIGRLGERELAFLFGVSRS